MKSITDLNTTWLYRLVKVVGISVLGLSLFLALVIIYSQEGSFKRLDYGRTMVTCHTTNAPSPYPLGDVPISIESKYFKDSTFNYRDFWLGYNEFEIREILKKCAENDKEYLALIESDDVFMVQSAFEIINDPSISETERKAKFLSSREKIREEIFTHKKADYVNLTPKMFDIKPAFDYIAIPVQMVIAILAALLSAELVRRILFYVILGKFRPPKT